MIKAFLSRIAGGFLSVLLLIAFFSFLAQGRYSCLRATANASVRLRVNHRFELNRINLISTNSLKLTLNMSHADPLSRIYLPRKKGHLHCIVNCTYVFFPLDGRYEVDIMKTSNQI